MTSKLASLRGKTPLNYTNEQFLDDSNDQNLLSIYRSLTGPNIIRVDITIIM